MIGLELAVAIGAVLGFAWGWRGFPRANALGALFVSVLTAGTGAFVAALAWLAIDIFARF